MQSINTEHSQIIITGKWMIISLPASSKKVVQILYQVE